MFRARGGVSELVSSFGRIPWRFDIQKLVLVDCSPCAVGQILHGKVGTCPIDLNPFAFHGRPL